MLYIIYIWDTTLLKTLVSHMLQVIYAIYHIYIFKDAFGQHCVLGCQDDEVGWHCGHERSGAAGDEVSE